MDIRSSHATLRAIVIVAAALVTILALAAPAVATPGRSSVCSNCHDGIDVPVTATFQGVADGTATYTFSSPTADSVAVFNGSTKLATINASSGQFGVPVGATYTVFAVRGPDTNDGIGSTTVTPQTPPPSDTTAPITSSNAVAEYTGSATILLSATDNAGGSGVAHTYYRLDGGLQTEGTTIVVNTHGAHVLEFWSVDAAGNSEVHKTVNFTIHDDSHTTEYMSVAGANRYETACQASQHAFPAGAPTVVIATGANWPDALGGGALAAALGGPILLTDASALPTSVIDEIERLGAGDAYILGGPGAVSADVEAALKQMLGATNVTRIGGANRYETANLIAAATVAELEADGGYDGTAFVGTGANFPDALAAAPLSAANGWPLYLSGPTGVSAETKAAMDAAGVDSVLILGGPGAVPAGVESALDAEYGDAQVTRLAGANRFATAVTVATYGVDHAGLSWDGLAIATGENFPDALAGGVMQGVSGSVMLLTPKTSLHADTGACLSTHAAHISSVRYLGGTGAVSDAVRAQVTAVLN